jgi:hypothetical protein
MYDDNPNLVNSFFWDISNPEFNHYDQVKDFNYDRRHDRGRPLSFWFYLITEGSDADGIPSMGIECAIDIVMGGLLKSPNNLDYIPYMWKVLNYVDTEYGICSEKSIAVRRAFEKIGLPVDIENFDGCDIEITNLSNGGQYICEEDNQFRICAVGNDIGVIPYNAFHWQIIGKDAIDYDVSSGTQLGTSIDGGSCLQVVDIPEFPYYPQTVTIKLDVAGYPTLTKRFIINDCDGDDPDCEEYHDSNFGNNGSQQGRVTKNSIENISFIKVYDIRGNLIIEGTDFNVLYNKHLLKLGTLYLHVF